MTVEWQAAILTTMDITTDGFGFMLAFGDLAWVIHLLVNNAQIIAQTGAVAASLWAD